jgi:hypothetical protein
MAYAKTVLLKQALEDIGFMLPSGRLVMDVIILILRVLSVQAMGGVVARCHAIFRPRIKVAGPG